MINGCVDINNCLERLCNQFVTIFKELTVQRLLDKQRRPSYEIRQISTTQFSFCLNLINYPTTSLSGNILRMAVFVLNLVGSKRSDLSSGMLNFNSLCLSWIVVCSAPVHDLRWSFEWSRLNFVAWHIIYYSPAMASACDCWTFHLNGVDCRMWLLLCNRQTLACLLVLASFPYFRFDRRSYWMVTAVAYVQDRCIEDHIEAKIYSVGLFKNEIFNNC